MNAATDHSNIILDYSDIQKETLNEIYQSTSGSSWYNNDNWLGNQSLSTWYGVTTDENGYITELYLEANNLIGI
jgi:hypothetical protein